jgi:NTE family protein
MSKKLGLALGCGGARGIAHIGVLKALEEEGIRPDYICGASMGAIVGACYSNGMSVDEMLDVALKLKANDLIDLTINPLTTLGLLRSKKVQKLFVNNVGDATFEQLKIPFRCVATDLYSGQTYVFEKGSVAVGIQASSAIPSVFRPVQHEGMLLVDGGVTCRVPVKQVKEMGADVVLAVDVLKNAGLPIEKVGNIFSMMFRIYDIMDHQYSMVTRTTEHKDYGLLLEPEMPGINPYAIKDLQKAFDDGYNVTKAHAKEIKEMIK